MKGSPCVLQHTHSTCSLPLCEGNAEARTNGPDGKPASPQHGKHSAKGRKNDDGAVAGTPLTSRAGTLQVHHTHSHLQLVFKAMKDKNGSL